MGPAHDAQLPGPGHDFKPLFVARLHRFKPGGCERVGTLESLFDQKLLFGQSQERCFVFL